MKCRLQDLVDRPASQKAAEEAKKMADIIRDTTSVLNDSIIACDHQGKQMLAYFGVHEDENSHEIVRDGLTVSSDSLFLFNYPNTSLSCNLCSGSAIKHSFFFMHEMGRSRSLMTCVIERT